VNEDFTPHSARRKCLECGLVNAGADEQCRRCGATLVEGKLFIVASPESDLPAQRPRRGFFRRLIWIVTSTLAILFVWYVSLLLTSNGLQPDQRFKVDAAVSLIEQRGFKHEAFLLRRVTIFRSTDNWWNRLLGHRDAFAATNFPFEIVTLYPQFFTVPVDDCERAAVLLHEARHLSGDGEEAALQSTWKSKRALGWTEDRYQQTTVWDSTARLTKAQFPYMFQCGAEGNSDCY